VTGRSWKMLLVAGNPVTLKEMRDVVIQKISSHAHKTGVLTSTSVFLNMEVPVSLGLLQKR